METSSKASKATKQLVAFLTASATLAIATLVSASSSTQVKQLDPLVVPRTAHAATALTDGRILITGGRDSAGNIVAVSEIFDPATETSTASATLTTPRVDHTATLLPDGRVLVAGGTGANGSLNSAEIFDPSNAAAGFRVLSATMGAARERHTATLLNSGKVLIAGGDDAGTAEIFDPATESFSSALLAMAAPRIGHTATLFSDDSVLLAGGETDSMELFTPVDQKFTLDPQKMSAARTGHEAIELSDTRLLFFEGDAGNTIDEFNHSTDTLTLKDTLDAAASSATLLANGKILVLRPDLAGLYAPDATDPTSAFTAFDETSVLGSSILPRSGQTATQLSGDKKILVAGGVNAQNLFQGAALFNPARIWTDKDDYQPGDNVVLSGSGWKPNENVYLYAVDSQTQAWTYGSTVTVDASGGFVVDPYFVVQLVQDGASFSVSAVGAQSAMQAEVKFTDATFNSLTVGSQTGTATSGTAASPTYDIAANFTGNTVSNTVTFSVTWAGGSPPTGVTTDPIASVTATGPGTLHSTLTIHTTAATPASPVGGYSFTVTGTPSSGPTKTATGTLTVNGQGTTLSVSSASGTYGGTASLSATLTSGGNPVSGKTISFTLNGNSVGPATTNASGVATITSASLCGTTYNAGSYPSGVAANFAGDGTYAAANGSASLTVGKATATVVVTPYTVTYDGNAHTATITSITGVCGQTGTAVGTVNVSNTTHTNAGTYASDTWSFTGTSNYNNIAATTIADSIDRATPTFTNLTPSQTISQGTATVTLNGRLNAGTNLVPTGTGTVTVSTASATISGFGGVQGNFSVMVNTSAILAGGPYTITYTYPGDTNFKPATNGSTTLTVNSPTTTTGVVSSLNPSTYGQSVTFTATVMSGSGTPTGSVTFYDGACGGAVLAGPFTLNGSGQASFSTSSLSVPSHTITACYSPTGSFLASNGNVLQTVNKATLTITAKDESKDYGTTFTPDGTTQFSPSGLVNSDSVTSVTLTSTGYAATATVAGSPYDIVPSAAVGTGLGNYNINYVNGKLAVNKVTLTITAKDESKDYGTTFTPDGATQFSPSGLVNGDSVTSVTLTSSGYAATATVTAPGPTYAIVPSAAVGTGLGNYNINYVNGTFTVNPALLTITAKDESKTYGMTFTPDGTTQFTTGLNQLFNGDSVTSVTLMSSGYVNTAHVSGSPYDIVPSNAVGSGLGNYTIGYVNGKLTVNPADASISVSGYGPATYDGFAHGASGTATGVFGESLSSLLNLGASFTNVPGGTANWSFNTPITNTDYKSASGSVSIVITKATATIVITPYSVTYDTQSHTATGTVTGVDAGGAALGTTLDLSGTTHTDAGDYTADPWSFSGGTNYYDANGTVHDVIAKAHLKVTADNKSVQYSDPLPTFTATITGFLGTDTVAVVSGMPAFTTTATVSGGDVYSGPGSYDIIPTVGTLSATNYDFTPFVKGTLTVTQEDARAYYTGTMFVNTSGPTSYTATVTLSATIKDISVVDPNASAPYPPTPDTFAGDIRNAKVTFINRDTNTVINTTPLSVGLVNAGDSTVGTVTYNWSVNLGTSLSQSYNIGIIVGKTVTDGYYTRNSSDDDTVVTVSVPPAAGSITGGGYLVMSNSAGLYPGGFGTKNNFGFNCQNTKSGVKGNINTIIRNSGRVYQVKGNSMTSLTTNAITSTTGTAMFNGKANIQDITNPLAPISIDGNATLQVTMTDNGEPGSNDTISITVFNKSGGVWFTSNWNGTRYVEQKLGGGNLQVR